MKSLYKQIIGMTSILLFSAFAFPNNIVGNPGDSVVGEFTAITEDLFQRLRSLPPNSDLSRLVEARKFTNLKSSEVVRVEGIERDAANIPGSKKTIILSRKRWPSVRLFRDHVWMLALHEYAGVVGIVDTNFHFSLSVLRRLGASDIFQLGDLNQLHCSIEPTNKFSNPPGDFVLQKLRDQFFQAKWIRNSKKQKCFWNSCPEEILLSSDLLCTFSKYDQRIFFCASNSNKDIFLNSKKSKVQRMDPNGIELEESMIHLQIISPALEAHAGPGLIQWSYQTANCL